MDHRKAYYYATASALISGIGTVCCKIALQSIPVLWTMGVAFLVGSFFFIDRRLQVFSILRHREVIIFTSLNALGNWLFILGLSQTSAINAVLLTKIEPYCVMLWTWIIFRKTISPQEVILLLLHTFGAFILSSRGSFSFSSISAGDLYIFAAMIASGYTYIYGQKITKKYGSRMLYASTMIAVGLLTCLIAAFFSSPLPAWHSGYLWLTAYGLLYFSMRVLWLMSLKHTDKTWKLSALRALGPITGIPTACLLLGERLTTSVVIGGGVVLATSLLITIERGVRSRIVEPRVS